MKPENLEDLYELSPMQQGMLFDHLFAPDSGVYFIQSCFVLQGNLNVPAFERAWQGAVDRHAALRTFFLWEDLDQPLQVVQKQVDIHLNHYDWRTLTPGEQKEQLNAFLREDRASGFDLSKPPLMRLALIRLAEDAYQFVWSYHHLILDGWSASLVLKEVFAACQSLSSGRPRPIEGRRSFRDYITWLQQKDLSQAETFWRRLLDDFESPTSLGIHQVPGSAAQEDGDVPEKIQLSPATISALKSLAQKLQLTPYTILLGTWALLLGRYSGEEDVVFGTVVSGRQEELPGIEKMVGLFINNLPVRVQVEPSAPVQSWLKNLHRVQLEMRQFEYSPLVQVQGWSSVPRGTPLFESIFIFENYLGEEGFLAEEDGNLAIRDINVIERVNYPLSLFCQTPGQPGAGLTLRLMYDHSRFDQATTRRMLGHYQSLLEGIIANPQARVSELPLLTEPERRQLLFGFNATQRDYSRDLCLHQLFERQAERNPEKIATVFGEERLSYGELNGRANQLAHYLRGLEVGPEVLVGICVERSAEMLVGLLGILKAGGVYLPLDPAYPRERLGLMLEDSGAAVLLTQEDLAAGLPAHSARVVLLDQQQEEISRQSSTNLSCDASPANLAYVIYTSGSTGKPKGVQICHGAVVNFLESMAREPGMAEDDILLAVTTLSFDISILELFLPLLAGASVVVASRETASDGSLLLQALSGCGATVMQATPASWWMLVESGWSGDRRLKMLCGGEALSRELADQLLERGGSLWNMYGPTETTVWSAVSEVRRGGEERVSIGPPIANTEFYVLDKWGQPVPVGIPGELHIGGAGLARGYLNRAELTAEKFTPDRFSGRGGACLYRTGDLVRYLENGHIEFLGRMDHQVKIRGFRIELGEIESLLDQHPAIRSAVVMVREDRLGDKRLAAYFRPDSGEVPTTSELRKYLQQSVPDYMVPSFFIEMDEFPLTPGGKVDRKKLPEPDLPKGISESNYVAPRTPIEEALAGVWGEILGVERVGVHDNFFELGGHSLLATQMVARLREPLQVELPLRAVFEHSTIAGLAGIIGEMQQDKRAFRIPAVTAAPRDSHRFPLSYAQQRLWFLEQLEPGSPFYNVPGAIHIEGPLNIEALRQAITGIVNRHEALRTVFVDEDGAPFQTIAAQTSIDLPLHDLSDQPEAEREQDALKIAVSEAQRPFDISKAPLLRTTLIRLHSARHILLVNLHHIVSDGWSIGVFQRELANLYKEFTSGEALSIGKLPIQYVDFTMWQREWLGDEAIDALFSYWKEKLGEQFPLLALPADRPRPPVQTYRGALEFIRISKARTQPIKEFSRQEGVTLFMVLIAAFKTLLFRYSGQEDIFVGVPIANRNQPEFEDLIGYFANTLVLRSNFTGNPVFEDFLKQVRETALGAYAHQDLPFEKLVEKLHPERDLSYNPLFQVMFVLQNAPMPAIDLAGLTFKNIDIDIGISRFDLTLYMEETGEGLQATMEYNTDLFDQATIRRMLGHYQSLLEGIIANPQARVSQLPLLTEAERRQLVLEWNDTALDYPQEVTLHQLFEVQAEKTPGNIAVMFENKSLTYRELNQRANQLAHRLQALGVGPEVLVGVFMERSLEMLISLYGILKAGGGYVPLDPEYPADRIAFMIEDTKVPVLLTQQHLAGKLPENNAKVISLDIDWPTIAKESPENPISGATPANLAYAIYTSGSTGQPKGVINEHRGICNRLLWMRDIFPLSKTDRVLQKTPFSFDVSVWEFFWPLEVGAQLVIARPGGHRDSDYLVGLIVEQKITTIHFVPSMLQAFLQNESVEKCQSLKRVICSGEALSYDLQERFFDRLDAELHNLYGPTEAAVEVTHWACRRESNLNIVPIGRPIANTQIYVLDSELQPVPVGVPGVLYIGGVQVARGYLNRPELTREKFIRDPFQSEPGARLYNTGDLARFLPDGAIEYLGRVDHQVKIRGFRIELGEIEALLDQHPAIRSAVVMAREDRPGDKRLAAYFRPDSGTVPTASELRKYLQQSVPDYMVPSFFIEMDEFPLTPGGKVDRKKLPQPGAMWSTGETYIAPNTPMEILVAAVWQEVMGIDHIGASDNFFDLGGHSLLSMRAIAEIQKKTGKRLNPREMVFRTLGEIAAILEDHAPPAEQPQAGGFTKKLFTAIKKAVVSES